MARSPQHWLRWSWLNIRCSKRLPEEMTWCYHETRLGGSIWLSSISELVNLSQARKWPKGRTEGLNIPVDNGYTLYDNRTLSHTFAATSLEAKPQPLQQSAQNSQMTTSPLFFALTSNLEPTIENQICCPNQSHKISCSDLAPLQFSHADNFQSGHTWRFHFFSSHHKAFLILSCLWVSARCRW